tara:strand:- start:189 stop:371 length:183 start_codon:yes stop_codon:yes gene_type:complete
MTIKDLIKELEKYDLQSNVRFYYLKDYNLTACKLETILLPTDYNKPTIEITIEEEVYNGK